MQLVLIQSNSGNYEARITTMTDEINALRAMISEKETIISKMRIEIRETNEKSQKSASFVRLVRIDSSLKVLYTSMLDIQIFC